MGGFLCDRTLKTFRANQFMDSQKTLLVFLYLLDNHLSDFPQEAIQDLPLLNKSLAELADDKIKETANLISNWCSKHKPLGKIFSYYYESSRQIKLDHAIEPLPENLDNTFREVRKTVQQKVEALKKAQDEKNG